MLQAVSNENRNLDFFNEVSLSAMLLVKQSKHDNRIFELQYFQVFHAILSFSSCVCIFSVGKRRVMVCSSIGLAWDCNNGCWLVSVNIVHDGVIYIKKHVIYGHLWTGYSSGMPLELLKCLT